MSGKLHDEDYKAFVPLVDTEIATEGKVNLLAQMHDFHGWDAKALWDDIRFSAAHCNQIRKVAIVGEKPWQRWMAAVCKPFTTAKVRYFDASQTDAVWAWLGEA
jgi:SpoIIAA-like